MLKFEKVPLHSLILGEGEFECEFLSRFHASQSDQLHLHSHEKHHVDNRRKTVVVVADEQYIISSSEL